MRSLLSDRTLSYSEHLSHSAAKLKSRSNLIAKLAGTSCGASTSKHPPHISLGSVLLSRRILLSSVG